MPDFVCWIQGKGIYETLHLPAIPRKGDILWLGSLTRGACPIKEVLVSKVEWAMDQRSSVHTFWITVRRMPEKPGD